MIKRTILALGIMVFSSSAFAGYIGLTGNIERFSMDGNKWNTAGAGIGLGVDLYGPLAFEGYFDFFKHLSPQAALGLSGLPADISMYSLHFGGKLAVTLAKILYIKAGIGVARLTTTASASGLSMSTTGTDMEFVTNAGVKLPIGPTMNFIAGLTYRKMFDDAATIYTFGGQAGIEIGF